MIEISGKYIFDISVGKYKEFITYEDLIEFTMIEEAGNCLPVFDLKFKFRIPELRNYFTENNLLVVKFGSSLEDLKDIPLRVFQKNIRRYGDSQWIAVVSGFYDAVSYIQETGSEVIKSSSGTGISATEAINTVSSRFFNFKTNITNDISNQKWLRCRKTARDFISDLWLHANIPNSFPAMVISKSGDFILKDMVKSMSEESKWTFGYTNTQNKNNIISISGNPENINDTGLINSIIQSKRNLIFNMDTGNISENIFNRDPILSNTSKLEGVDISSKDSINYYTNNNVHSNYWQSYINNLNSLSFFSGVRTIISYADYLIDDMNVLDIAEFLDLNPENPNETEGHHSGKYIISKLVRTIGDNKNLNTHVVLCRESANEVRDYQSEVTREQIILEDDKDYTLALNKLEDSKDSVRKFLSNRGLNLTIPNIRILPEDLMELFKSLIGFDLSGIWIRYDYLLSLARMEGISTLRTQILSDLKNSISNNLATLVSDSDVFTLIGTSKDRLIRDLLDFKNMKSVTYNMVNNLKYNITNLAVTELIDLLNNIPTTNFIFSLFGINKNSILDILNNSSINYKSYLSGLLDNSLNNLFGNTDSSLPTNIIKNLFLYWLNRGEVSSLETNSDIIQELNSNTYTGYIQNGNMIIPNLGSTSISPEDWTANIFSWYISGLIDEDSINTGNLGLDDLISRTIIYLKTQGINNPMVGTSFRRFWGTSNNIVINDNDIRNFYSHISNKRSFSQSIKCNNEYMYILYPEYMLEGRIRIDGNDYTNLEVITKNIKIDDNYQSYILYRTKDKFNKRIKVDVI